MSELSGQTAHKWYVVRAVSGQEKKVKDYINSEINRLNIGHLIPQILIPLEKVYQLQNGKKVLKEKTYLPGYILVEATLDTELQHILKNITGVIGFLGETKNSPPVPLRQSEVNRILGKVDDLAEVGAVSGLTYTVGENVKVMDGPFNGFSGVIEEVQDDKKKLKVMVKIFGRKTPLELNYIQVEKE